MNLKFWKKNTGDVASDGDAPAKAGLVSRLRERFAILVKGKPSFTAEVSAEADAATSAKPDAASAAGAATPGNSGGRLVSGLKNLSRTQMIAGGVIFLLLLLAMVGILAKKIITASPDPKANISDLVEEKKGSASPAPIRLPSPIVLPDLHHLPVSAPAGEHTGKEDAPATHETAPAASKPVAETHPTPASPSVGVQHPPAHETKTEAAPSAHEAGTKAAPGKPSEHATAGDSATADDARAEIEKLKKEKAELQAKVNALQKEKRNAASVKMYPGGKHMPAGGEATISASDPKAATATLKDAIDAMNNPRKNSTR